MRSSPRRIGGLGAPFTRLLTVSSSDKIDLLTGDAAKLSLRVDSKTGVLSGHFLHPVTGKTSLVTAVAFQDQNVAGGFFSGGAQGGSVAMEPNSSFSIPMASSPQGKTVLPQVAFLTPKDGARVDAPGSIELKGTAKSKSPIVSVQYQLLYSGTVGTLQAATGSNTWTASFKPSAEAGGFYRIFVKAADSARHESDVAGRTIFYVVRSPLVVTATGAGNITEGFAGTTLREIGATYTITATPSLGHSFGGWTGSVIRPRRRLLSP